ncbi:MAG: hypothetical protein ACKOSQ_00510 [Planctomycetaceae bacterium]
MSTPVWMGRCLVAAQALASAAMCGVIWFVQVVHYPLFARRIGRHDRDAGGQFARPG